MTVACARARKSRKVPCYFPAGRESQGGDGFAGDCLHHHAFFDEARHSTGLRIRGRYRGLATRIHRDRCVRAESAASFASLPPVSGPEKRAWCTASGDRLADGALSGFVGVKRQQHLAFAVLTETLAQGGPNATPPTALPHSDPTEQ